MLPRNLTRLISDRTIQIPLRWIIVGPFVGTTLLIAGLTGYLSLRNGQQAANDLAEQLIDKTSAIVIQHLDTYLAKPQQVNQTTLDAIEQGMLNPRDFQKIGQFFWKQVQNNKVSYINYALLTGKYARGITSDRISKEDRENALKTADYLGVGDQQQNNVVTIEEVSFKTKGKSQVFSTDNKGNRKTKILEYDYSLLEEAWPQQTVKANKAIWSSIYQWDTPFRNIKISSIAAARPIYDNTKKMIGIIAVDLSLEDISRFLRELEVKPSEKKVFIVQKNGQLVATSSFEKSFTTDNDSKPLNVVNSSDETIKATAEHLLLKFGSFEQIASRQQDLPHLDFMLKGERQLIDVQVYQNFGLKWLVVVVIPESEFMARINANTQMTIIFCLLGLVVAALLGIFTSNWIIEPITKLSSESKAIDPNNLYQLNQKVENKGFFAKIVKEFKDLYQSVNQMRGLVGEQVDLLSHRAKHDALTGLPNRAFFMERLDQVLKQPQSKPDYLFAVLFIDIDRFKIINDSLGHTVGDRLLIAVAKIMQECLRRTDMIARFGGDEFTILLENLQHINEAISVAERIHAELMSPLQLENLTIAISASIGIVEGDTGKHSAEELLRNADNAMYCAKEAGKARYKIFNQEMYERTLERLHLERDLRQAIELQEFLLHYQPIVSLKTDELVGFEALIRWQHPERGLVSPAEFIPVAEDIGLIVEIGEWVMLQACQQMREWQLKFPGAANLEISVNLASPQIKDAKLIERIDGVIANTCLDGSFLKLEITESMLVEDNKETVDKLKEIRGRKIQLSIDDFGSKYASFKYLACFPNNTVKIDGSFIRQMNDDPKTDKMVEKIIDLAHDLKLDVTAEYVQTYDKYLQLKALGCDLGQGEFFSLALDSKAAESLILSAPYPWIAKMQNQ